MRVQLKKLIFYLKYKRVYLRGENICLVLDLNILFCPLPLNLLLKEGDIYIRHRSPPRRKGGEMAELILLSLDDL